MAVGLDDPAPGPGGMGQLEREPATALVGDGADHMIARRDGVAETDGSGWVHLVPTRVRKCAVAAAVESYARLLNRGHVHTDPEGGLRLAPTAVSSWHRPLGRHAPERATADCISSPVRVRDHRDTGR